MQVHKVLKRSLKKAGFRDDAATCNPKYRKVVTKSLRKKEKRILDKLAE